MIRTIPIDAEKIRNALAGIGESCNALSSFVAMDVKTFLADKNNYALTEHHFRRALEGILTVGTHLLSRLPVKTKDYQEIIVSLGTQGIIPKDFADSNKKLAGYRNRLVHIYWEVSSEELLQVIKDHMKDIEAFCGYFEEVLRDPAKFNLRIE